jgi:hypothetical protein
MKKNNVQDAINSQKFIPNTSHKAHRGTKGTEKNFKVIHLPFPLCVLRVAVSSV